MAWSLVSVVVVLSVASVIWLAFRSLRARVGRANELGTGAPIHSALGIASTIFFVLACASLVGSWVEDRANRAYLASKPPPYDLTEAYVLSALFGCSGFFLLLIGVALACASLCKRGRRKLFGALGLALNSILLLAFIVLIVLVARGP
jgi:hypothetical protein